MTPEQTLSLPTAKASAPASDPFVLYDSKRDFSQKKFGSACYAPFLTLDFYTTGNVQVCCENSEFPIGNLQTDSLKAIWRGAKIQQLREALKRYDFSLGCQGCELAIRRGGQPYAKHYEGYRVGQINEWPRLLQFRLSNLCNFACVMCSGELSSVIRRDREKKDPLPRAYNDRFFDELWEFLPHLNGILFAGGEPLLIPEHFRVWEMLLQSNNSNAEISINTNGSIWNDRIAHYLDRINLTHLIVSLDGATKETFESVRIGSNFDVVMANLRHLDAVIKKIRPRGQYGTEPAQLSFTYCLMPMNFHEMPDVFLLAEDWEADVLVNDVTFPRHLSFLDAQHADIVLAHDALRRAYDHIQSRLSPTNRLRYLNALSALLGMARTVQDEARGTTSQIAEKIQTLERHLIPHGS